MKTIITAIACCLIMTAATAQENYYKTDGDIYIDQNTTLVCHNWETLIMLEFKSDPSHESMFPEDKTERLECDLISNYETDTDWDRMDPIMMAAFLETFTDGQIMGFYTNNEHKNRTLFTFNFYYDRDGNVVKANMVFKRNPTYTSVPPAAYAKFMQAFRDKFKLNVRNKKYPYYYTLYGFMVPNISIIPKSTKK